ncbi:hypothetical protein Hdeb2414_s0002g00050761 [Helianthus debilis subsp. tardiflorus]
MCDSIFLTDLKSVVDRWCDVLVKKHPYERPSDSDAKRETWARENTVLVVVVGGVRWWRCGGGGCSVVVVFV